MDGRTDGRMQESGWLNKQDPAGGPTIARPGSSWCSRRDLHPRHLVGHLLHAGRSVVLGVGGPRPRQIHGSLVVLLRDGRPGNTAAVSVWRGPAGSSTQAQRTDPLA